MTGIACFVGWLVPTCAILFWIGAPLFGWPGMRELRMRKIARQDGFFMEWPAVECQLRDGRGVLEYRHGASGRVWYWPDDGTDQSFLTVCPWKCWTSSWLKRWIPQARTIDTDALD